jgi:hypothetical protein
MPDDLREPIAEAVHDLWGRIVRPLLSQCHSTAAGLVVPTAVWDRWQRQMATPYPALSEPEKNIDRAEADWLIKRFNRG